MRDAHRSTDWSHRAQQHADGRADAERMARDIARSMRPLRDARHGVPFRHPVTGEWCVRR